MFQIDTNEKYLKNQQVDQFMKKGRETKYDERKDMSYQFRI